MNRLSRASVFIIIILLLILSLGRCQIDGNKKRADLLSKASLKHLQYGLIEGSLSYPSQKLPADLRVCAQNLHEKGLYCTTTHLHDPSYEYGEGYRLALKPGLYQIYSQTSLLPGKKAYYSKFVTCGLKVDCPSHEPISVEVRPGEKQSHIDPGDWYAP